MNNAISESNARAYITTHFPNASKTEQEKMITDWARKLSTARGVVADFKRRVGDTNGMRMLDAGSGCGGLSIAFTEAGANVVGVEIEDALAKVATKEAKLAGVAPKFLVYDGMRLPFKDNSFDAIVSVSVLEHTSNPQQYMGELLRVLKPEGKFYLAFPNRLWPKETHTGLWFLTYLPLALRNPYVRIMGKNPLVEYNLHFYSHLALVRMIRAVNASHAPFAFARIIERGGTSNILKRLLKAVLGIFGIPHQAVLQHIMYVFTKKDFRKKEKIKVALMSYALDGRHAKGSARVARRIIEYLILDPRFHFTLVHYEKSNESIYQNADEIIMPKICLPIGSRFFSQMLFFFRYRNQSFDIMHWFQPRLYPFYWLAPAKKIVVTAHGAGDITAPGQFVFSRRVFNFVLARLNWRVDAIIGDSKFGKKEIMEHYHFDEARSHAIWIGGGEEFSPLRKEESRNTMMQKYDIGGPYILDVSRLQPHKNIDRLITSYIHFREHSQRKEKLLIVGAPTFNYEKTYALARESKYTEDIFFLSYVDEYDLGKLYAGAELFVFPSLNEGFGLPIIEAMSAGTPVITSNTTSMPEIAGSAGITINPTDVEAIAQKMEEVLSDKMIQKHMIAQGLERAKLFTWDKAAKAVTELYLMLTKIG